MFVMDIKSQKRQLNWYKSSLLPESPRTVGTLECQVNYYKVLPKDFVNKCIKLAEKLNEDGGSLASSSCLENSTKSADECRKEKETLVSFCGPCSMVFTLSLLLALCPHLYLNVWSQILPFSFPCSAEKLSKKYSQYIRVYICVHLHIKHLYIKLY